MCDRHLRKSRNGNASSGWPRVDSLKTEKTRLEMGIRVTKGGGGDNSKRTLWAMTRTGRAKASEGFWARANDMLCTRGRRSAERPTSDSWQSTQARWLQSRQNKQRPPHLPPGDVQRSGQLKNGVCERSTWELSSLAEHLERKGGHWWTRRTSRGRGLDGSSRDCLSTLEKWRLQVDDWTQESGEQGRGHWRWLCWGQCALEGASTGLELKTSCGVSTAFQVPAGAVLPLNPEAPHHEDHSLLRCY